MSAFSASTLNNFNYSDSNENMYTNSVAPSILVELISGSTYTTFEKDYLDTFQDYYLRYNTQISTDYVDLEAVGSTIFVSARSYNAITKNGKIIAKLSNPFQDCVEMVNSFLIGFKAFRFCDIMQKHGQS